MYKRIPTYNSHTKKWTTTVFETKKEYVHFVRSKWKLPGEYNLKNTINWIQPREEFLKTGGFINNGMYCSFTKNTKQYKDFWISEGRKCRKGVIIDDYYVTGYFYDYLNYTPIFDKVKNSIAFAEIWDSDYHYFLYIELCLIYGKNAIISKKRQWGYSLKTVSIFKNDFIFNRGTINKIVTKEEPQLKAAWEMFTSAINFSNTHTGWYRQTQGAGYEMSQLYDGKEGNRKVKKGRATTVKGVMTKLSPTRNVGGASLKFWFEESGVNDTLDVTYEYASPAIKQGGVATGLIIIGGSVGQLKHCEPLRRYTYAPEENGFYGVPDLDDHSRIVSFFVPQVWNYIHTVRDEDDPELILSAERCYDEDGNSDIKRALELVNEEDAKQKQKSPIDYALWKSQNPMTLDDLYGARESNIFPVHIVNPHYNTLMAEYTEVTVELEDTVHGIEHKLVNGRVAEFPVTPASWKDGCVVIYKFPKSTKFGLHVAGIDPVSNIRRNKNQESLMSCYIYQLAHEFEGEFVQGEIVASYTGRFEDPDKTYRTILNLVKMYNARAVIESDNKAFIDWMVFNNQQVYMVKRSEIPILRELVPNSNIAEEYGLRMGSGIGDKVKKYCFEKFIEYMTAKVGEEEMEIKGEKVLRAIYGVTRIKDKLLLKEVLNYNETLNVDRIIAASIAIMYGTLLESRHLFYKIDKRDEKNKIYEPVRINSLVSNYNLPSFTKSMRGRFGLK